LGLVRVSEKYQKIVWNPGYKNTKNREPKVKRKSPVIQKQKIKGKD